MAVEQRHVDALALLLGGQLYEHEVATDEFRSDGTLDDYALLLAAALVEAVRWYLPQEADGRSVIELVATVRAVVYNDAFSINPDTAERLVVWALKGADEALSDTDVDDRMNATLAILLYLSRELELNGVELNRFCRAAADRLDQSIERQ